MDPHEDDPNLAATLRAADLYAQLKYTVRRRFNGQAVTNAWLKMYEMLMQMPIADRDAGVLRVFCNAEFPGAFICAINHYMCSRHPHTELDWVASSLWPSSGGALGDTYGIYECNKSRWLMGEDMPGDVTDIHDVRELAARALEKLGGRVDLYTSDAGIDVSSDYLRQEELTAHINLGQVVVGLMVLEKGGSLVTKTYTFSSSFSISLLSVCSQLFDTLDIVKPRTSRPGNSETYMVGLGFRGLPPAVEKRLVEALKTFDYGEPLEPLTQNTVLSVLDATNEIHLNRQTTYLGQTMDLFDRFGKNPRGLRRRLAGEEKRACAAWLEENPVLSVPTSCHIPEKKGGACTPA